MIEELEPIIICGAPGGGTSYFTKFLRRCNFYAGKSIEEGRGDVKHIGWLGHRKWHESVTISKTVTKPIVQQLGISHDKLVDPNIGSDYYRLVKEHLDSIQPSIWIEIIEKNIKDLRIIFNEEFSVRNVPYGWKDPRNVYLLPFWKMLFPKCKILTVERHINPDPTRMGTEGVNFTKYTDDSAFRNLYYSHSDDFRFTFEEFDNIEKVNELLKFVRLEVITESELRAVLKDTKFQYSKIGKA